MKTKTEPKVRAPIIKELHYSKEEIVAVKKLQTSGHITKRKDGIRNIIRGPMCSVCHEIPTKHIFYNLSGVTRVEGYCDICFTNVYQKNEGVDIHDIMEAYGCTKAPPNTFGGSKVEKRNQENGYSLKPKSSLDNTIICNRCRVTRIFFNETQRGHNNVLIPLEYRTLRKHDCPYSYPFFCQWCDAKLVFNREIRADNGKLVPLHFEDDRFHVCPKKPNSNRNIDDV